MPNENSVCCPCMCMAYRHINLSRLALQWENKHWHANRCSVESKNSNKYVLVEFDSKGDFDLLSSNLSIIYSLSMDYMLAYDGIKAIIMIDGNWWEPPTFMSYLRYFDEVFWCLSRIHTDIFVRLDRSKADKKCHIHSEKWREHVDRMCDSGAAALKKTEFWRDFFSILTH